MSDTSGAVADGGGAAPVDGGGQQPSAPNPAGPGGAPAPSVGQADPTSRQHGGAPKQPSQGGQELPSWQQGLPDETRGFIQNKGWEEPGQVIDAYRNLEKHVGKKPLALPESSDDETGWNQVYDALGRPKTPADYNLPIPEGSPEGFGEAAAEVFHKAGLNADQAQNIVEWYNQFSAEMSENIMAEMQQQGEADIEALRKEWGQNFDAKVARAQQAARYFGIDEQMATDIELGNPLGARRLLELMANIGETMAEDRVVEGSGAPGAGFGMTPEAAKAQISELKKDPNFQRKLANRDAGARRQWDDLHQAAFPD